MIRTWLQMTEDWLTSETAGLSEETTQSESIWHHADQSAVDVDQIRRWFSHMKEQAGLEEEIAVFTIPRPRSFELDEMIAVYNGEDLLFGYPMQKLTSESGGWSRKGVLSFLHFFAGVRAGSLTDVTLEVSETQGTVSEDADPAEAAEALVEEADTAISAEVVAEETEESDTSEVAAEYPAEDAVAAEADEVERYIEVMSEEENEVPATEAEEQVKGYDTQPLQANINEPALGERTGSDQAVQSLQTGLMYVEQAIETTMELHAAAPDSSKKLLKLLFAAEDHVRDAEISLARSAREEVQP